MIRIMTSADDNARLCADLVRAHDWDRYIATLFAPADRRPALFALYAFAIEIERVSMLVRDALPGEIRLRWWLDALEGREHGGVAGNPVAAALAATIREFGLPIVLFERLIEAHRRDLYDEGTESIDDLESCLADTSGAMIALARQVLGGGEGIDVLSRRAGLAIRLTALLASWPAQARRRQLLLPRDWLARFNVTTEDIFDGRDPEGLRALCAALADRARDHLREAERSIREMPAAERPALLPLALVPASLGAMHRTAYRPLALSQPSRLRRIWTLWRAAKRMAT